MASKNPLYFLTHEGNPDIFSGYGIPVLDGKKSPLLGMLMVDRPSTCPDEYLQDLTARFGGVLIGKMTKNGDRGILTEMIIEEPMSLGLLKDGLCDPIAEGIGGYLLTCLKDRYLPKPKLRLHWSSEERLWVSELGLGGVPQREREVPNYAGNVV